VRLLRTLGLLVLGFYGGVLAAAALVKRGLPSRGDAESDEVALVAIFGGAELKSRSQAFRGGSALAWFGGVSVDLRDAKLAPDARLTVSSLWGGVSIVVPEGWRVEADARALAGGVGVNVPEPDDPEAPTLAITAAAAFGGVGIVARPASAAAA
jgi:hypothetical protein